MSASVIEGPAEPAIADERRSGRGRGRGTGGYCRVHTSKFAIDEAIDRFADLACRTDHAWSWDGTSYPKTKRSDGPNVEGLAMHNEPLKILLQLAPNGYPDPYRLRDLLMKMHSLFNIFAECHTEGHLSPSSRAAFAADSVYPMQAFDNAKKVRARLRQPIDSRPAGHGKVGLS